MLRLGCGARRTSLIHRPIEGSFQVSVALVVLAGWLVAAVWAAPAAETPEDVRRLAAGEVIVTDALLFGATKEACGGTAVAFLRAPFEEVWRVIVDYRGHPRYYPHVIATD